MEFKAIDTKCKEIYFSPVMVEVVDENVDSSAAIWNALNSLAVQNLGVQRVRQIA